MISLLMSVVLIWDAPATRTDGTVLPVEEIDHYEMQSDGSFYDTTTNTEMDVGSAQGVFRVRCCDVWGGCSDWSNELQVTVTGRGRPNAPGQLRKK